MEESSPLEWNGVWMKNERCRMIETKDVDAQVDDLIINDNNIIIIRKKSCQDANIPNDSVYCKINVQTPWQDCFTIEAVSESNVNE